jgi:hypothetical protein
LGDRWLATWPTSEEGNERALYESTDGIRWSPVADARPPQPLAPALAPIRDRRAVLGIQFEQQPSPSGGLWRSADAVTWTEIESFRRTMPRGAPDHLLRSGHWWVLGGISYATGMRREWPSMWASPDLRRWFELPEPLRGRPEASEVGVYAAGDRVLGYAFATGRLWVWTRPT